MKFTSTLYSTVTNGVEYTSILDTTPAFLDTITEGFLSFNFTFKKEP